jgi:cell fate regulator YaaT (PSP1 superfamily)
MTENDELQAHSEEEIKLPDIKYKPGNNKLDSFNWLSDLPGCKDNNEIVEIRFKNTRKGFYRNINNLRLEIGDIVAVEASPGHDIGRVSMVGCLVKQQMKELKSLPSPDEMKKVYRKAKPADIIKWEEARMLEIPTMLRSRQIAEELKLNMKIGDVEYQGDKTKAIFYYIADERVDFRQLIKVLAEEFKVRIEMRQIGARQEAGRIGGIGACGRELCCATYITNFMSVTTTHAKYQELSLNPQKLAGQCGKLKCCLNYEVDCYVDAQKSFPQKEIPLETTEGTAYFQKMEVHKGIFWYSTDAHSTINLIPVPVQRVKEIQEMNRKGLKADKLIVAEQDWTGETPSEDLLKESSIHRFDSAEPRNKHQRHSRKKKNRKSHDRRNN